MAEPAHRVERADHVAKVRACLKCRQLFESTWCGNRICPACLDSDAFESTLPDQFEAVG